MYLDWILFCYWANWVNASALKSNKLNPTSKNFMLYYVASLLWIKVIRCLWFPSHAKCDILISKNQVLHVLHCMVAMYNDVSNIICNSEYKITLTDSHCTMPQFLWEQRRANEIIQSPWSGGLNNVPCIYTSYRPPLSPMVVPNVTESS